MTDSETALLKALQNPELYPHPVERIELIETHISWVLLTGQYAYKIKKPVNFGFVDFSTLARRRQYCADEVRLNRRFAPELYVAVIAIGGAADNPGLDAEPAFEYAVKMRQFKQEQLLSHLAQTGRLQALHIDLLAREIAEFHQRVAGAEVPADYGQPEQIERWAEQNFSQIMPLLDTPDAETLQDKLAALHNWTRKAQAALQKQFSKRLRQGFVRECHGDLHLGNMVLLNNQVRLFDCIEFNPELRWIDVQSDLGFAVMDLYDRHLPRLARRLLNGYLSHSGDYAGVQVLPFYSVYRALVRAKVGLLRLHQEGLSNDEYAHIRREFEDYLDLAQALSAHSPPCLYITHGLAGSGKSTAAAELGEQLGAIHIRADIERKRMHGLDPWVASGNTLNSGIYSETATQRTYGRLAELADIVLQAGFSCVIDATFLRRWQRDMLRELAERHQRRFMILDVRAPLDVLRERIETRSRQYNDPSEATLAVLEAQRQRQEPLTDSESQQSFVLDSHKPFDYNNLIL